MVGDYCARLMQDQFVVWHGMALDRTRAEALARILTQVDQATADALGSLDLEDQIGDRDYLVSRYRSVGRP